MNSPCTPVSLGAELLRMVVRTERDIFVVRQRAREVARALGMEPQDQVRVATALSEVSRQLLSEVSGARITFVVRTGAEPVLATVLDRFGEPRRLPELQISDELAAVGRLMGGLELLDPRTGPIVLTRRLPPAVRLGDRRVAQVRTELAASPPTSTLDELSVQNQQLLAALEEVQQQRDELRQLNAELSETNRGVMAMYSELSQELEQTNQGVVALYAELDERSARLRAANDAKRRFFNNVSHELRAPATAIIELVRLMQDPRSDPVTEEQFTQLELIKTSGADLLGRINDLLDLARAESHRIEPRWGRADLPALFAQLHGTLRPLARAGVALVVDERADAPGLVTDELLLTQVLRNLLTNGLKFTEHGEVRLTAVPVPSADRIDLVVTDTGVGIPDDEQQRIFEEFHQVRGPLQAGTTGTGLGLSYARRLTTLLGGELTVRSTLGAGSVFTVSLPRRPTPAPGESPEEPEAEVPEVGRVLLVDDDPAFRRMLGEMLTGMATTVEDVADGAAALDRVCRNRPDVIFLDLRMPGISGIEVLATLAANEAWSGIPVIVVTGIEVDEGDRPALAHAAVILDKAELGPRVVKVALRTALAADRR